MLNFNDDFIYEINWWIPTLNKNNFKFHFGVHISREHSTSRHDKCGCLNYSNDPLTLMTSIFVSANHFLLRDGLEKLSELHSDREWTLFRSTSSRKRSVQHWTHTHTHTQTSFFISVYEIKVQYVAVDVTIYYYCKVSF